MAGQSALAEVAAGIVVDGQREVDPIVEILFDRGDRGDFSAKRDVEYIHGIGGADPDSAAHAELDVGNANPIDWRLFVEWVIVMHRMPFLLAQSGRSPRIVP